jgi:cell wall-associated NlpC family hydrolase
VLRRGDKAGATRKEKLAAAETGLVESDFENLPGGDLDSEGWRQERTSIYGTGPTGPRNVGASADRFYKELRTDPGAHSAPTAGVAAQAAQGSAYPERYDEVKPQANAIVKAFERGGLKPAQQRKLAATKRKALNLGLAVGKQANAGIAPKKVVTRFKAIKAAAGALTKRHIPYVWGGGHGSIESAPAGLDCSGAVSWVLNKAGILKTPLTSGSMGEVLKPGPGAVTVFYNAGHTFMKIGNEYWGTSVGDSGAGGLGPHPVPSASYLAQYSVGHVPGLGKKQALQLGFSPTASESFPGMTLSASGTSAIVDSSATATRDKPGFSKSPIKLTPNQKAHQTLKKLEQLGAGVSQSSARGSEDKGAILAELEKRYGAKAA